MYSEKKPALLHENSGITTEAFTYPNVYTDEPEIIYLLENCLKICNECIYKSVECVIRSHI